jgi:hypothetical protein
MAVRVRQTRKARPIDHHVWCTNRSRHHDLVLGRLRLLLPTRGRTLQFRTLAFPRGIPVVLHDPRHVSRNTPPQII